MKQTQTKMFDFADTGLDFSPGSKNLFPDRFKKMLALGYNVQTVSNVAVSNKQVTFTYGGAHGYMPDRVLKVDSGALSLINEGEFWIDSVTTNTVTMTIDAAPLSIGGGFTTRIASLGWSLVYEHKNIHLYKFKQLDESDIFIRIVFQDVLTRRNRLGICVGKTADPVSGVITDSNALQSYAALTSPNRPFAMEFGGTASNTANNYTYSQGVATYGKWVVIGSKYHLIFSGNIGQADFGNRFNAILPFASVGYEKLNYPVIIGEVSIKALTESNFEDGQNEGARGHAYIGAYRVCLREYAGTLSSLEQLLGMPPKSRANYLPANIDTFNTTAAEPISVYEYETWQFIGMISGGAYQVNYSDTGNPDKTTLPLITGDIDLNSIVYLCGMASTGGNNVYWAVPVEEVRIA